MKKTSFLYFILAAAVLASCRKDKAVFSQSPDQRVNAMLAAYQDSLVDAPYGWKGYIFPSGLHGGVVGFYFKFNNSNRVQLFSDFDSLSAVTMMESSYRLKALQQPVLIFDTYCYVTVLSDPDGSVNGGAYGSGLLSDFEFAIDSVTADTVHLTGRLHSSKAYLVKASKQDADDYYNQKYSNRLFDNLNKYITYFKRVTIGATTYEVLADPADRKVTITWIDNKGNVHTVTTGYYYTATGVGFTQAILNGSQVITGFDNITWNAGNLSMTISVSGYSYAVSPAGQPMSPDPGSGNRWWQYPASQGQGGKWLTLQGFHAGGVDDALGITTTSNFYYLSYEPAFGSTSTATGTITYDITGYYQLINNGLALNFAPAFQSPSFFNNGITKFSYLGYLGVFPSADSIPVTKTWMQFTDANGYYFVQRDSAVYDMVSAKDAKTWVRWLFN